MTIIACGINHKSADIATRERVSVNMSVMYETLHDLLAHQGVNEAVVLSTCNRTEIFGHTDQCHSLVPWMSQRFGVSCDVLEQHVYQYHDIDAVAHIMQVASGLDSMILGEPQILGQIKKAYVSACDAGSVGSTLMQLFPTVFQTAKKVREQTALGAHAVSLAYLVCKMARQIFTDLQKARILFVGAGETNELIAEHLVAKKMADITVANRSPEGVRSFCQRFNARAITLPEIVDVLRDVDIVISATASQLPIVGKGAIELAQKKRRFRPLLLVDLAVPRDIEVQASEIENVYLYNMDDLQNIIAQNKDERKTAALAANDMVNVAADQFMRAMTLAESSTLITRYRQSIHELSDNELQKALAQLQKGVDANSVLSDFSRSLMNKFLHQPTLVLRDAIENNHVEKIHWFKKWFNL